MVSEKKGFQPWSTAWELCLVIWRWEPFEDFFQNVDEQI